MRRPARRRPPRRRAGGAARSPRCSRSCSIDCRARRARWPTKRRWPTSATARSRTTSSRSSASIWRSSLYQPFTRDARSDPQGHRGGGPSRQLAVRQHAREQRAALEQMAASGCRDDRRRRRRRPGSADTPTPARPAMAQFAPMQLDTLETFQSLERDQQGYATSNSLLAIVSAIRSVPGRKSVVFFSEGLSIPPNVQSQFVSVIDAANRANVSIYPMDAAGLRTESPLERNEGGRQRRKPARAGAQSRRSIRTGRPMMMALENNEALLRADPHSGLGTLADRDRRLPHRQHQRSARRVRHHRNRHAELLRADLHAEERALRRQVPHHRRQGAQAATCASGRARATSRCARPPARRS